MGTDLIAQYRLNVSVNRLMLFPRGVFRHPEYGKMTFDDTFFQEIKENFDAKVLGQTLPFIDVDHSHGAAAGWIQSLSIEPDGLYADVDWTALGEELVGSGQYRYMSPWWGPYKDPASGKRYDRVLRGGGLTNIPFLKVLPAVELYEAGVDSPARQRAHREGTVFVLSELVRDDAGGRLVEILRAHFAAKGDPMPTSDDPREHLRELAEKRAREKSITFTEALREVQLENIELAEQVAHWCHWA